MNTESSKNNIKWPEIFSLASLNVAVAISWIAYSEYQTVILGEFGLNELGLFLIVAKAIILVTIPPLAGLLADMIMRKRIIILLSTLSELV